jgi:hypothetical protein
MEKKFTEEDSLKLINQMIVQVNSNIQKGAANSMIMAGYSVAATAILNLVLLHVLPNPNMSFWVWTLMIPLFVVAKIMGSKQDKHAIVKTHIDKIIGKTWEAFAYSVAILLIILFGMSYHFKAPFMVMATPVILTFMGLAQYITATASKFKPFYWGVIAFWAGALLCLLVEVFFPVTGVHFIILAICTIIGFVLPGHILNSKAKKDV